MYVKYIKVTSILLSSLRNRVDNYNYYVTNNFYSNNNIIVIVYTK